MSQFDFPYHKVSTDYPESSFRANLGGSYQFSAPPVAPDQRVFKLRFALLKYFSGSDGKIDNLVQPELNMGRLEAFYNAHKLHATFTYPHPVYGNVSCRFNKPLRIPEGLTSGDGAIQGIEIEFIEQPGLSDSNVDELTQIEYVDFTDEDFQR